MILKDRKDLTITLPYPFSEDLMECIVQKRNDSGLSAEFMDAIKEQTDIDVSEIYVCKAKYKTWNPNTNRFEYDIETSPEYRNGFRDACTMMSDLFSPAFVALKTCRKKVTVKRLQNLVETLSNKKVSVLDVYGNDIRLGYNIETDKFELKKQQTVSVLTDLPDE